MWEYDDGYQRVRLCFGKFQLISVYFYGPADSGCIRLCCFPSDFQPEFEIHQCTNPIYQENGALPSGVYLYIGITSCAYRISQFFLIFNMVCYLK